MPEKGNDQAVLWIAEIHPYLATASCNQVFRKLFQFGVESKRNFLLSMIHFSGVSVLWAFFTE
jgi:hypothetical protein